MSKDWSALHQAYLRRLREKGLTRRDPFNAAWRSCLAMGLVLGPLSALALLDPDWPLRLLLCALAALGILQTGLIGHDTGHHQIVPNRLGSFVVGHIWYTLGTGQAFNAWKDQHDGHHARPGQALEDPDLQTGLFILAPGQTAEGALGRFLSRNQGWIFIPALTMQPMSMRVSGWRRALSADGTLGDRIGTLAHFLVWLILPIWVRGWDGLWDYLLVTLFVAPLLYGSFLWNHVGAGQLGPSEKRPLFLQALEGTRELAGGPLTTWFFGGLNYHVEHHLCPEVPVGRLPEAHAVLMQLLQEEGMQLRIWSWREGMADVLAHLRRMQAT